MTSISPFRFPVNYKLNVLDVPLSSGFCT